MNWVVGYEDPCATSGLLLRGRASGGGGLREDGDSAGARTGGEEIGVGVEGIESGYNWGIYCAFRGFVCIIFFWCVYRC